MFLSSLPSARPRGWLAQSVIFRLFHFGKTDRVSPAPGRTAASRSNHSSVHASQRPKVHLWSTQIRAEPRLARYIESSPREFALASSALENFVGASAGVGRAVGVRARPGARPGSDVRLRAPGVSARSR